MSCFMVSNETINRVVHLLALDRGSCEPKMMPPGWHDAAGYGLLRLNAKAVCDRYEDRDSFACELYRWSPRQYTRFQMLKAAQCWRYQASDAEDADESEWFQEVGEAIRMIQDWIVSDLPEYEKSDWDAPERQACCGEPISFGKDESGVFQRTDF